MADSQDPHHRYGPPPMPADPLLPLRFLLLVFAGLVSQEQAMVVDYLREENRVSSWVSASCDSMTASRQRQLRATMSA